MNLPDFDEFLDRYHDAPKQWMHGNPNPWAQIDSHRDDLSTFEAWGGTGRRWGPVGRLRESPASRNRSGTISFESQQRLLTTDPAATVDVVRGPIGVTGVADEIPFDLRVTAILRVEEGGWKLAHRHADPMVKAQC